MDGSWLAVEEGASCFGMSFGMSLWCCTREMCHLLLATLPLQMEGGAGPGGGAAGPLQQVQRGKEGGAANSTPPTANAVAAAWLARQPIFTCKWYPLPPLLLLITACGGIGALMG